MFTFSEDYDDWLEKEGNSTSQQAEDETSGTQQGYEYEDGEYGYDLDFNVSEDASILTLSIKKISHFLKLHHGLNL